MTFLLFEEPEAFLHPDWQSKLIDFFVLLKQHVIGVKVLCEIL